MQFPIIIGLHRSRILDGALLLLVGLVSAALLAWPAAIEIRLANLSLAMGLGGLAFWKLKPAFNRVRLDRSGLIAMCLPGQSEFVALRLLPGATVHPWITVLRLRDERDKSHLLVVTRDMTNKSDFRRLRVFLRWRAKFSEG